MICRPYAELASHLYKRRTAGPQYAAYRGECLTGIGLAEVLDDTIGKHAIETARFERKEWRVGTNEICCKSELRHDRPSGENEPDVRIDRSNLVTLPGRAVEVQRPQPQPTSSKRSPPSACGKRTSGIGYSRSFRIRCEYMYPLVAPTVTCTAG